MKKSLFIALLAIVCQAASAVKTMPLKGTVVSPTDTHIRYAGRISFANPERPAWNYPGIQIVAAFEGTSLRMLAKPRSGIGAYRNYGEPKSGSPGSCMPVQYEYTGYAWNPDLRKQPTFLSERWDFSRYQPDVVCINLGTNDLSTDNYDLQLLKQGYQKLLQQVRRHNPQAKILFLTGSMLGGKELQLARQLLDEVAAEARKAGDQEVYRFDLSPIDDEAFYGNDYHPNVYEDEKMAAELTAYLRKLMGWF